MAEFDPKAYLKSKGWDTPKTGSVPEFDPKAYLKSKELLTPTEEPLALEESIPLEKNIPPEQQISQFEALLRGTGRGATAEFLDELRGAVAGAAGTIAEKIYEKPVEEQDILKTLSPKVQKQIQKTPELKAELSTLEEPKESTLDKLQRLYKEYRDAERYKSELAEEQYPGTTLLGQIAGGLALPAGIAGKGATLGAKFARGALTGAAYGGATGLGLAETTEEMPSEALKGAGWGAALGGALPLIGAGVGKAGKAIKGTKTVQNFLDAFDIIKKEPETTFIGQQGRDQIMGQLRKELPAIQETMKTLQKETAQQKGSLLTQKTNEGQLLDLTQNLQKAKDELKLMLDHPSQDIQRDAALLLDQIDDILVGKKGYIGFKKITGPLPQDIAMKKATEARSKLAMTNNVPTTEEGIINKMAEISRSTENKLISIEPQIDQVVADLGEIPGNFESIAKKSEFIHNLMKENPEYIQSKLNEYGIKKLPRMPEFTVPKPAIDAATGQRLIETVDTNTGVSIIKATPDKMLTNIEEVVDPVTNQKFLQFVDIGTEKTYRFPVKEDTYTKVVPVPGRSGGSGVMTPEKADKVIQAIQKFTPVGEKPISREIQNVALDTVQDMKLNMKTAIAGYEDANAAYSNIRTAMDNLGLTGHKEVEDILSGLGTKIADIEQDTKAGHFHREIMKNVIDRIKSANLETGNQLENQLQNLATRLDLSFTRSTPGIVAGKAGPTIRTGLAGVPIALGELTAKTTRQLSKMKENEIFTIANKAIGTNTAIGKKVGNILSKIAISPERIKQSLIFGLMQQAPYREFVYSNKLIPEIEEEQ